MAIDYAGSPEMLAAAPDGRMKRPGVWDKIRSILGSSQRLNGRSEKQFIRALSASFQKLKQGERLAGNQIVVDEIEATLARYSDDTNVDWASNDVWIDAYRIEGLLIHLYGGAQVSIELARRITKASEEKLAFADFYLNNAVRADPGTELGTAQVETNRTLLGYLIDDMQWHYNQLYLKRDYANAAQRRVAWTFIVALLIFVVVMIAHFDPKNIAYKVVENGPEQTANNEEAEP